MRPAMSSEKKVATPRRKKYSASTRDAIVDAASGNSGVPVHMRLAPRIPGLGARGPPFTSNHDEDERTQTEHRGDTGEAQRAHHDEAIAPAHRVVVIAVEEECVGDVADPAIGCFDDRVTEIARSVLDPEQIARQPAVRCEHEDPARVRELLRR